MSARLRRGKRLWLVWVTVMTAAVFVATPATAHAVTARTYGYSMISGAYFYGAATYAKSRLIYTGYSTASYQDNSGCAAYNGLQNTCAVWHFSSHGLADGGGCRAYFTYSGTTRHQYLLAEPGTNPSDPYVDEGAWRLNNLTSYASKCLLATFQCCHSYLYNQGHVGNDSYHLCRVLTQYKGVDAAVGFMDEVSVGYGTDFYNPATYWSHYFYLYQQNGSSVSQALYSARDAFLSHYGDYGGYNQGQISGNSSLKITPVRYSN